MTTTGRRDALIALGALGGTLYGCSRAEASRAWVPTDPLVVHEWGTFTTMQGSTFGSLDGLQHESERLPAFVHSRFAEERESPFRAYGDTSLDVPAHNVGMKMETPVIYFHTRTPRRVSVHVNFEHGLLTHFYPAPRAVDPPMSAAVGATAVDVARVERSWLDWELDLLPGGAPAGELLPVEPEEGWQHAREVDAADVRTVGGGRAESERYVFYRGLARFESPIVVQPVAGDRVIVRNCGDAVVADAFVLDIRRGQGRFVRVGALGPHGARDVLLGEVALRTATAFVPDLEAEVHDALIAQGLFDDEARAMVRTWSRTWFEAEGTRVLYFVPRATTDAVLPLSILPKPDALLRILVGRHEYLTPETEDEVESALRDLQGAAPAAERAANQRLARLGRFTEPAVRAVFARTTDDRVRAHAEALLAGMRS
jgi:hypothetical protein